MRNLKFISLIMGCLAAVCLTFTSCNDDDDDYKGLTPEQVETAFNAVRGDYNGIMLYAHKDSNGKQVNDSTNIAWSIQTDSVMTIYNFPVASLAKNVTDSTVSKAIATAKPQNLKCYIGFINMSPVTFLINPISVEFTANYGGKDHKIQVPFYVNNYYSFGQRTNGRIIMQIIAADIYSDGVRTSYLSGAVPYGFSVAKK